MIYYRNMNERGFTLIEMLVAIFVFSIVIIIAVGAIVSMFNWYGNIRTTQRLFDALNFSIDAMVRDIRFGSNYECNGAPNNCEGGSSISVKFVQSGISQDITYSLKDESIVRKVGSNDEVQITPDGVVVERFDIYTYGGVSDPRHPMATFIIEGVVKNKDGESDFSLQTTVTQQSVIQQDS